MRIIFVNVYTFTYLACNFNFIKFYKIKFFYNLFYYFLYFFIKIYKIILVKYINQKSSFLISIYRYKLNNGVDMNNNDSDLFRKVISKNKYVILRNFLENNKQDILKLLHSKARYKDIFETFKEISNINIDYVRFCQILSEFKTKYIYNQELKDITPKEKIEASDIDQPKILAAKISEVEQKARAKETEKIETKKDVPADETPNNNTNSEEPKKLSRKERLLAIKNSEDKIIDVQKNQEKFIWTPSIKK